MRTDNVQFELEAWYSPSQGRRYRAPLPPGYEGEFGPGVKTFALQQTYSANVSQGKLLEQYRQAGLKMSSGWLASLAERGPGPAVGRSTRGGAGGAGRLPLATRRHHRTPVDGENWWCHVQGNPLFTAYHTLPKQDRLAVLAVLGGGGPLSYLWNTAADVYLDELELSAQARRFLRVVPRDQLLDEATLTGLLDPLRPWVGLQPRTRFRERWHWRPTAPGPTGR